MLRTNTINTICLELINAGLLIMLSIVLRSARLQMVYQNI